MTVEFNIEARKQAMKEYFTDDEYVILQIALNDYMKQEKKDMDRYQDQPISHFYQASRKGYYIASSLLRTAF